MTPRLMRAFSKAGVKPHQENRSIETLDLISALKEGPYSPRGPAEFTQKVSPELKSITDTAQRHAQEASRELAQWPDLKRALEEAGFDTSGITDEWNQLQKAEPIEGLEIQVNIPLDSLEPLHAQALIHAYGLNDGKRKPISDVGTLLGLSREGARQVLSKAESALAAEILKGARPR